MYNIITNQNSLYTNVVFYFEMKMFWNIMGKLQHLLGFQIGHGAIFIPHPSWRRFNSFACQALCVKNMTSSSVPSGEVFIYMHMQKNLGFSLLLLLLFWIGLGFFMFCQVFFVTVFIICHEKLRWLKWIDYSVCLYVYLSVCLSVLPLVTFMRPDEIVWNRSPCPHPILKTPNKQK